MKRKTILSISLVGLLGLMSSCSNEDSLPIEVAENNVLKVYNIELDEGTLSFDSKESLTSFLENENEEEVESTFKDLKLQGFSSLKPTFEDLEGPEVEEFLAAKANRIASKGKLYSSKGGDDEIDLDDEIISDDKFAKLLNLNRAITVGKNYYRYTTDGLYFCLKKDKKKLKAYLKKLTDDKSFKPSAARIDDCEMQKSDSEDGTLSLSPVSGVVTSITSEINKYEVTCGGSGGGTTGGGSSGGTSTTSSLLEEIPMIKPMTFGSCAYSPDSIWQKAFGERVKCNDYHDSTHRVQTQFWNENYFVWASIGSKVKYQKKRWIGWSKSTTADFVEIGLNSVKYTWHHTKQYNPFSDHHLKFKYKGVTYYTDGTQSYDGPINPNPWPLHNKEEILVPLVIQIDDILGNEKWSIDFKGITAGDLNNGVKELLKLAASSVPSNTGLQENLRKNNIDVQIVRYAPSETNVIVSNRIKRQTDGDAIFRFDSNFLLTYDSTEKQILKTLIGQINAKKYSNVEVDLYGAAYRNGVLKGKRIKGKD